jgi:hypothetical protein
MQRLEVSGAVRLYIYVVRCLRVNNQVLRTANISSARPAMLCSVWNPKVRFRIHNIPSLVSALNHIFAVCTFPADFLRYSLISCIYA